MYTLFALLTNDKLVLEVSTLRRNMFDIIDSHNTNIEEMKANNIYPVVKEIKEFNPETHREHIEWVFNPELDIVEGRVTILLKDRPKIYTRYEFRNLFTQEEKVAIYTEANTNINLKIALDDLASAEYIELLKQETVDYMNYLVYLGLISQTRFDEIYEGLEI
jgi:hypothetical protein